MDEELFDPSCSACERAQEDFAKQEKRIAELERERIDSQAQLMVEQRELLAKLAAAQATIARKDEVLAKYATQGVRLCYLWAQDALALPNDRTALDAMLAEAEKRGMLKAALICDDMDVAYIPCECADAIRQAAERSE